MKNICFFLFLFLLSACSAMNSRIPELVSGDVPDTESVAQGSQACKKLFVSGNWQFVHSINFAMASGRGATLVGVTVLDGETLKTVLMTVEGFVLFEAVQGEAGNIHVNRALPPFDNTDFAKALLLDVRSLFPHPASAVPLVGRTVAGDLLCRYPMGEGQEMDILPQTGTALLVHIYGADGLRIKTITEDGFCPVAGAQIPKNIQLTVPGLRGYTLKMSLLSAEKIE